MLPALLERFHAGDRLALARLLTLVARGEAVEVIRAAIRPPARPARVVALTGAGGVGKSTLTGKLLEPIREQGKTVAVLACDPQSPLSGGALLGDRFRMPPRADDPGVYIRSLAAAGGQGALASHLDTLIALVEAFGFEVILVETVGAGQGDTAVRALVDVLVLLRLAQDLLADRFAQRPEWVAKWQRGEIDDLAAARAFLKEAESR